MKVKSNCAFLQSYERLVQPDTWTWACPATKLYSERACGWTKPTMKLFFGLFFKAELHNIVHINAWVDFSCTCTAKLLISNIFCLEKQVVCGQAFDAECINISLFFLFWFWCILSSICLLYIFSNEHGCYVDTSNTCIEQNGKN